jgi:hypothetical protein
LSSFIYGGCFEIEHRTTFSLLLLGLSIFIQSLFGLKLAVKANMFDKKIPVFSASKPNPTMKTVSQPHVFCTVLTKLA